MGSDYAHLPKRSIFIAGSPAKLDRACHLPHATTVALTGRFRREFCLLPCPSVAYRICGPGPLLGGACISAVSGGEFSSGEAIASPEWLNIPRPRDPGTTIVPGGALKCATPTPLCCVSGGVEVEEPAGHPDWYRGPWRKPREEGDKIRTSPHPPQILPAGEFCLWIAPRPSSWS